MLLKSGNNINGKLLICYLMFKLLKIIKMINYCNLYY